METQGQGHTVLGIIRWLWRWGGWLFGVVLFPAWDHLVSSKVMNEIAAAILRFFALSMLIAGACIFLAWCGYTIWRMTPAGRFQAKSKLIERTIIALEFDHSDEDRDTHTATLTKTNLHKVISMLGKFKVPHPPLKLGVNRWLVFLSRLLAASQTRDLKWAMKIWPDMENETK